MSRAGTWVRGKYHLDRELGDGGMAVVYAATHRNKKRFAVKVLRPELSTAGDIRTRFLREGYVANSVDHPGVVAVLDDDVTEDGCAFLVMELLDGDSVDRIADKDGGKLDARTVLAIAHELLDVLVAAHQKNVVHRDLKPANLFVTREGKLKVLDFGIARIRDAHVTDATHTGIAMGTPAFMSPEQARGKSSLVGPKSDLWSVGATMFSLLTGLNVHEGESAQEVVFAVGSSPARSLAAVMPDAPQELVAIVDRALAFDPADRWPDAATMRDAVAVIHEASAGHAMYQASLASLVGRVRVAASHPDLTTASADDERAETVAAAHATVAEARAHSAIGRTTAEPVSSRAEARRAPARRLALAGGAAVALVTAGALFVAARHERTVASPPASQPTASQTAHVERTPTPAITAPPAVASESAAPTASTPQAAQTAAPAIRKHPVAPTHHVGMDDFDRR